MKNKTKTFEEDYFEGWFKGAVGNFGSKDLESSKNWFYSWLKKLEEYIPIKNGKGKQALDIGCSIGGAASLLKDRGYEVYASDISKYAIDKAKKLSPDIHFSVFDVEKGIPIKQKFDLIITFEVVEHLKNPEVAIENMYKSLKKGGYLVVSTPYPYKWVFNDPTHINVRYPKQWLTAMKQAGFKNPTHHKFSLLPFFYKFNRNFQVIIPFHVPNRYINTPIFYIGLKT